MGVLLQNVKAVGFSTLVTTFLLYVWHYSYWQRRNVKQKWFQFPIFGDVFRHFFQLSPYHDVLTSLYENTPETRYFGFYQYLQPGLMIKDPELIKSICVRDKDSFLDHFSFLPKSADQLWDKNLFALQGDRWKEMRNTLSPAFTGRKMRIIFGLVVNYSETFCGTLLQQLDDDDDDDHDDEEVLEVELKDLFTRYTTDVIASVAFGLNINSLHDPENEFYQKVKQAMHLSSFWKNFKLRMTLIFPIFGRIVGANIFDDAVSDFFRDLIQRTIAVRKEQKIFRPDMLQLLMQAHEPDPDDEENNEKRIELDQDDIASQALLFFLGGFETASNALCFLGYELAINEDIQERLIYEVDEYKNEFGLLTYDGLNRMPYMDMVVSETMRKWPPLLNMDRVCVRSYFVDPELPGERPITIEKSTLIWIPVWCIHRDPKFWESPEVFDPERFSEINKANIDKATYLPFGMGPRSCLGNRFALMEIKILLYELLCRFRIVTTDKSEVPFVPLSHSFSLASRGGFQFGLKRRNKDKERQKQNNV